MKRSLLFFLITAFFYLFSPPLIPAMNDLRILFEHSSNKERLLLFEAYGENYKSVGDHVNAELDNFATLSFSKDKHQFKNKIAFERPIANAVGGIIDCDGLLRLNGFGSSIGSQISYLWTTQNGNILEGDDTLEPLVDAPGDYRITVTDLSCNLSASFEVEVVSSARVDAGEPILYCEGELPLSFELSGNIYGNYLEYFWSSSPNLSAHDILNPIVEATPAEIHSLNAELLSGTNLFVNGNFESGNTNFYTQYIEGTDVAGKYLVTNDPKDFYGGFASCGDHTLGYGNMMVLDGSTLPDQKVWCQQVDVSPNTTYAFSAWFQNVCATCLWGEPIIDFRVNNQSIGIVQKTGQGCIWEQFTSYWDSDSNMTAEFCLFTDELDPVGNDFAIDDISLYGSCIQSDEIPVMYDDISATFNEVYINCAEEEVTLSPVPSGTDLTNVSFEWSSEDGDILEGINDENPLVAGQGNYELLLTNLNTNCHYLTSYVLTGSFEEPIVSFETSLITCDEPSVSIISSSDNISNYSFEWTSIDGAIISGENSSSPIVDKAGIYFVLVTDVLNGCTSEYSVEVQKSLNVPDFSISNPNEITCSNVEVEINALISSNGDYKFYWETFDGNILGDAHEASILVNQIGTYELNVVDLESGCSIKKDILVTANISPPVIIAINDQIMGCLDESVALSAGSNTPNALFNWTTENGNIIGGEDSGIVEVNAPGEYLVTVIDPSNNCYAEELIVVRQDSNLPIVNPGSSKTLNCNQQTVTLDASESSNGDAFSHQWSTEEGNIISGDRSLNPIVDKAGVYHLLISNNYNGCVSRASVIVNEDHNIPAAEAGEDKTITCEDNQVLLGHAFFTQVDYTFEWTSPNGNFLGDVNQNTALVDQEGSYFLKVTNTENGCTNNDQVIVIKNIEVPSILIETNQPRLTCDINETILNVQSNALELEYSWSSLDGNIIGETNQASIQTSTVGTYEIVLTNLENSCTNSASFEVEGTFDLPEVEILTPQEFLCDSDRVRISANNFDEEGSYSYEWTTTNGQIDGDNSKLTLNVKTAGLYNLNTINESNGCMSNDLIEVFENTRKPSIELIVPDIITCGKPEVELEADVLESDVTYNWTSQTGNILSTVNEASILVDQAGVYKLEVKSLNNNCLSSKSIDVFADQTAPIILIEEPAKLTCDVEQLTIDATEFSNSEIFSPQWSTSNGNIISGEQTLSPTVNQTGDYQLEILNTINECSSSASINVEQNVDFPNLSLSEPAIITCENIASKIEVLAPSDVDLAFNWDTQDGNIIAGQETATLLVNGGGLYEVLVTNTDNGCERSFEQFVEVDTIYPNIDAGEGFELDCNFTEDQLQAEIQNSLNTSIFWETNQGNIINGANTLQPTINQQGTYFLIVTNQQNARQSIDSVYISQNQNLPIEIISIVESPACFGDFGGINIESIEGGESPYLYAFNGGVFNDDIKFDSLQAGNYYPLAIQDANGCELDTLIQIPTVPNFQVNTLSEVNLIVGDESTIHVQTNIPEESIEQIIWTPATYLSCNNCLEPIVTPLEDQTYELIITTENGCIEKASISFKVDRDIKLFTPNVFSPFNQDGINDLFYINAAENTVSNINLFEVYDRWGNKVFKDENFLPNDENHGWDGTFKNRKASLGVYVWHAELLLVTGEILDIRGDVSIIK